MSCFRLTFAALLCSLACATTGAQSGAGPVAGNPSTPGAKGASAPVAGHGAGQVAEDFSIRDIQGQEVRLSEFSGKVVLIDFWATWCVPCCAEIPLLQQIYDKYRDQGFTVIGVSMDGPETEAQVLPFVQRTGLTFPIAVDEETRVANQYNPAKAAPLSVLIDRTGRIYRTREGYSTGDEKLVEADVQTLLKQ